MITHIKRINSIWKKDSLEEAFQIKNKDIKKIHSFIFEGISWDFKKRKYEYYVQFSKSFMVAWKLNWGYTIFKGNKREEADLDTRKDKILGKLKRDMYKLGFKEKEIEESSKKDIYKLREIPLF